MLHIGTSWLRRHDDVEGRMPVDAEVRVPTRSTPDGAVVAVVLPALNEEATVGAQVRALRAHPTLLALPIARVIVVDNGSDDATAAVARAAGAEVVCEPRRGYGYACLAGVRAAAGVDIVLLMDADGSDDPAGAARVVNLVLCSDADLAVGSRTRGRCEPGALTLQQRVGNAVGALILRLIYGVRVSDLGPVRALRREVLLWLDMHEMGYGWSTEMLAKAARADLHVREVPVDYHRRAGGRSKVAGTLRGTLLASAHILRTLARYVRWRPAEPIPAPPRSWGGDASRTGSISGERRAVPSCALFIAARAPVPGRTKTRLGHAIGHEAAARLYAAFLRDLGARFTAASASDGYDLFWFYAPSGEDKDGFTPPAGAGGALLRQEGPDLAARLQHGFATLASYGYGRIIVIGSDSPHLSEGWVRQAFAALDAHDVVIGPARDGGYYLLGQRAHPHLCHIDLFTDIPMSTPEVYARTCARAEALGLQVATLPATFDVDELADLYALRAALSGAPSIEASPAPETLAALEALTAIGVGRAKDTRTTDGVEEVHDSSQGQ
jgi:rSAM/selenodomain-associated transferase 1